MATRPNIDTSYGTLTNHVAKAGPGSIVAVFCSNVNAAIRYFQLFDNAAAPTDQDVPLLSFPMPIGSVTIQSIYIPQSFFCGREDAGLAFANGISWGLSSTVATWTAATAANHNVHVLYF